ncbi:hypothetical protein [Paludibacterium yongneupense]|uniref:hypothetical protein n=1 Tax=Paludibacterium yongneupense TaxID=400061 RepID=UPI000401B7F1|nr:hypothetical protein [Paludibacterium yongneupense]
MKTLRLCAAALLLAAGAAHAEHVHFGVGVMIGPPVVPLYAPAYYYPPVYRESVIVVPPTEYVEQDDAAPAPSPSAAMPSAPASDGYWYYCARSQKYYPYVKKCPAGWMKVSSTPSDAR